MELHILLMFILPAITLIPCVGLFTLAPKNRKAKWLAVAMIPAMSWTLFIGLFLHSDVEALALFFVKAYYISAALSPLAYIYLALVMRRKVKKSPMRALLLGIISLSVCVMVAYPELLIKSVDVDGHNVALDFSTYMIYAVYFASFFSAAVFILLGEFWGKRFNVESKKEIRIFTICLVAGGLTGGFFNLFLPFFGNYDLIWAGPLCILFFIPMAYRMATTGEHFSAIKTFIQGLLYCLFVLLSTAPVFFITQFVSNVLKFAERSDWERFIIIFAVLIFLLPLIFTLFSLVRKAIKKLDSDGYDEKNVLNRISQIIAGKYEPAEFLKAVRHTLKDLFGVNQVDVIVFDRDTAAHLKNSALESTLLRLAANNKTYTIYREDIKSRTDITTLQSYDIEVITPIISTIDGKAVGVIVLSPRGRRYDRHYGETLERVSAIISPPIQSATFYRQILGYNDRLKEDVRRKTQKLQESNEELREADARRSEALTISSHNLRTPLTSLIGIIDMMLDGDFGKINKEQREMLEMAEQSGQTMNQVISSVLDASKIDSGDFNLKNSDFNLSAVVDEEINLLKEKAKQKGIAFIYNRDRKDIKVFGDMARMKQVIINIVDNAIFYGKSRIEVNLYNVKGQTIFEVIDDGIGVPLKEQPKLFQKMFRASNSGAARPDGTGIGLYVVKKTIEASGGKIIFKSVEGEGSTFGFELESGK